MSIDAQKRILPELREAVSAFLYPLKTTRVVNREAFARIESLISDATRVCKADEFLAKELLREIYLTARSTESEEEYAALPDRQALQAIREKLDFLFALLILGESPEDRVPGVPRIL